MDFTSQRFLMGASAGGVSYWLTKVDPASITDYQAGWRNGLDSTTGDLYSNAFIYDGTGAGVYQICTIKVDKDGVVQFVRVIDNPGTNGILAVSGIMRNDDAGYITLGYYNVSASNLQGMLYFYQLADGSTSSYKGIHTGAINQYTYALSGDTATSTNPDIIWISGLSHSTNSWVGRIDTSTATITSQSECSTVTSSTSRGCRYDPTTAGLWLATEWSSTNAYVEISYFNSTTLGLIRSTTINASASNQNIYDNYAICINSSGNPVWAGKQQYPGLNAFALAVSEIDGTTAGTSVRDACFKVSGSNTNTNTFNRAYDIVADSSDNYYIVGELFDSSGSYGTAGYSMAYVLKLNSLLQLQWVNVLYQSVKSSRFSSIKLASDGALMVTGHSSTSGLSLKLDPDGGGTGTYGVLTYSSYSLSTETSVMGYSSSGLSYSGGSDSIQTLTLTNNTKSHTETNYELT